MGVRDHADHVSRSPEDRRAGEATAALAAARDLGPFFEVDPAPGADWISWAEVLESPAAVQQRVAEVHAVVGAGPGSPKVEDRVSASLAHLGLVARLLSPVLGAALVGEVLPVSPAPQVHLHISGSNPLPMALTRPVAVPVGSARDLVTVFGQLWLGPTVNPLGALVRERYALSPQTLAGNVSSAVAGALNAVAGARPELRPRAHAVLTAFSREGPLAGAGHLRPDGNFVRRSCCLFYRVQGAGTCADCVLGRR